MHDRHCTIGGAEARLEAGACRTFVLSSVRMKKVALVALVAALAGGAGFGWLERSVRTPMRPGSGEKVVWEVPRGATGRSLGARLERDGLIRAEWLWRYHLWRRGGLAAKAGRFELGPGMSVAEIASALEGNPLPEDEPFVIVEGWRLRDTDEALARKGWIEPGAYLAAASDPSWVRAPFPIEGRTLEGYLYPETYGIVPDRFDVRELVQRQLDTFVERFWKPHREEIASSGRTLHQIVIMASLLEREEPVPEQRPLVAGILWKRLDAGMALGVDATSRYELPQWNDRKAFLQRLRDPDDAWNTRLRRGLPPGPIGAPTLQSLIAALRPEESPYWYYLHDQDRTLRPSRTAAEHEALRRKYNVY